MFIVFYSTSDVFRTEELLIQANIDCKVVPTPTSDKAYCGVCIETCDRKALELVNEMEFDIVE